MKIIKFHGRRKKNILFVLKERVYSPSKISYGLMNSAMHVAEQLSKESYNCKVVSVIDANGVDKEMYEFKPDLVVFEALWMPTAKMQELMAIPRYSEVKFVVRVHSDIGFLSAETNALRYINEYRHLRSPRLTISFNDKDFTEVMSHSMSHEFTYLPNIIVTRKRRTAKQAWRDERDHIDIGCFGAMRLLKNQCFQALCAIKAADMLQKKLRFHVTANLAETVNDSILENLKQIFVDSQHDLIIHNWMNNEDFQKLVQSMDLGLQLSFSESFNIVAADFVNNDRMIVVSDAIDWLSDDFKTSTSDYEQATRKIVQAYINRNKEHFKERARKDLTEHNEMAIRTWKHFLKDQLNEY